MSVATPDDSQDRQREESSDASLPDLAQLLTDHSEELVSRQAEALREHFSAYQPRTKLVPDESLSSSAQRNVHRAAETMKDGRAPAPEQIDEAWVGRERAEQGMLESDMLSGYRLAYRMIRDGLITMCNQEEVDPATVLQGACLLWETADAGSVQVLQVRRDFELARGRFDHERKVDLVRGLLRGTVDPGRERQLAAAFGLLADQRYVAVCGFPADGESIEGLRRQIESSTRLRGVSGLVVRDGNEVVGIVPRAPRIDELAAVVGVSDAEPLARIAAGFQSASRMMRGASRFGFTGVYGPSDLRLRVAIADEPELSAMLVNRYFGPLRAGSSVGVVIEETIRSFLAHGRHKAKTARILGIHANTLRYRLHRFEELAGVSLEDPATMAELWWAVEASRVKEQQNMAD